MKKILGALVCALTLFGASVQAEAAPIAMDYSITSATFTNGSNLWESNSFYTELPYTGNTEVESADPFGSFSLGGSLSSTTGVNDLFSIEMSVNFSSGTTFIFMPVEINFFTFVDESGSEYLTFDIPTSTVQSGNNIYTVTGDLRLENSLNSTVPFESDFGWLITDDFYSLYLDLSFDATETAPTPEPATMLLMGLGLAGLGLVARRRK